MHNEEHHSQKHAFGFWVYLMTDLLMFAAMFATFIVLRNNVAGGPEGREFFSLSFVFVETFILLTSSFTTGLMLIAARSGQLRKTMILLGATFLLGVSFLGMELVEFGELVAEGHTWQTSAFLSAFFSLVGMHGLHIFVGLLWAAILFVFVTRHGLTSRNLERLTLLSLFWHFLDLVWIFIFTIVYLLAFL